ncbi:hypothetical protein LWI28_015988 [Acer negundo]|uniref:Uncharacterized protein n=1 Tax=Acer negundo TaxID=4023 RepID=A0AAD5JUU6_ACENE|nr:hypothetical protein LWI28_015988 [Acer negundo]
MDQVNASSPLLMDHVTPPDPFLCLAITAVDTENITLIHPSYTSSTENISINIPSAYLLISYLCSPVTASSLVVVDMAHLPPLVHHAPVIADLSPFFFDHSLIHLLISHWPPRNPGFMVTCGGGRRGF